MIIMVEAHVVDAWTREADRHSTAYMDAVFVAGLAAPLFLFLAGVSSAMSASARARKTDHRTAARLSVMRGWQVFALAFLFRAQSQLLGWGPLGNVLKVDILNVMGLAMVAAGLMWGLSSSRAVRVALFAIATVAVAMTTPLVREASALAMLPDPIEAYIRPLPSRSNFALFPWAGFLFAGLIVGELVAARLRQGFGGQAAPERSDKALQLGLLAAGLFGIAVAYGASFQPSIYPAANFWTSSPTFFFIRLGICTALVPIAWVIATRPAMFVAMGRSSLFVYWIHVEMVYGVLGRPLRGVLPLSGSLTATVTLCLALYGIVLWKNRVMERTRLTGAARIFAPVLK